jgi:hypothetical protein
LVAEALAGLTRARCVLGWEAMGTIDESAAANGRRPNAGLWKGEIHMNVDRILCAVAAVVTLIVAAGGAAAIEPAEQRIELTIRDSTYLKTKTMAIRPELPVTIVIHNEDTVRHGFTSPLLSGLYVEGEGEGIEFFGRGLQGIHIGPGKTAELRLVVPSQGSFPFHCDLHTDMKDELYLLQVPVA